MKAQEIVKRINELIEKYGNYEVYSEGSFEEITDIFYIDTTENSMGLSNDEDPYFLLMTGD